MFPSSLHADSNPDRKDPVSYPEDLSSDSDSSLGNSSQEARSPPSSPYTPASRSRSPSPLDDDCSRSLLRTFPRRRRYNRISRFDVVSCSSSSSVDLSPSRSFTSSSRSPSPPGPRFSLSPGCTSPLPVWKKARYGFPTPPSDSDDDEETVYILPTPKRRLPRRRVILQEGKSKTRQDELLVLFGPMTSCESDLDDDLISRNNNA